VILPVAPDSLCSSQWTPCRILKLLCRNPLLWARIKQFDAYLVVRIEFVPDELRREVRISLMKLHILCNLCKQHVTLCNVVNY
jgi:hypothetical protein